MVSMMYLVRPVHVTVLLPFAHYSDHFLFYALYFPQIQYYERLSPLIPSKIPLGSFSNIQTGDCIVTFSRREIYKLKVRKKNLATCNVSLSMHKLWKFRSSMSQNFSCCLFINVLSEKNPFTLLILSSF